MSEAVSSSVEEHHTENMKHAEHQYHPAAIVNVHLVFLGWAIV